MNALQHKSKQNCVRFREALCIGISFSDRKIQTYRFILDYWKKKVAWSFI